MMPPLEERTEQLDVNRAQSLFRYGQVGMCVNSVTHDINNYLGAVLAYADLVALEGDTLSPDAQRMLSQISEAVQKSSAMLQTLTTIARKPRPDSSLIDPAALVARVLDLRRYDFRSARIDLELKTAERICSLVVDIPALQMALLYLLTNGLEAAQDSPSPRLVVTVCPSESPGTGIDIQFKDSGPAIPDAIKEKMFDPFFTTKDTLHTGLGLTLARETARAHGGDLVYDEIKGLVLHLPSKTPYSAQF